MADLGFALQPACHALLDFDVAIERMAAVSAPLAIETVPLTAAAGRVLAAPVIAAISAPPVDVAAMDGYAVGSSTPIPAPATFVVRGQSFPGNPADGEVGPATAMRIFTGAPMPRGADRVIVQEDVARHSDIIVCPVIPAAHRHVRAKGSDFAQGEALLPAGRLLDPRAMVVAAAAGAANVDVWRKPRVAIIASGDELVAPGQPARSIWSIPDSISLAVAALAEQWGASVVDLSLVPDRLEQIEARFAAAMETADIIVMVGGASTGDRDFARRVAGSFDARPTFSRVAMKPGKPVWHGVGGRVQVLGLPGNPTAALTTARLFLAPLICQLTGRSPAAALQWRPTALASPIGPTGERETFLCGDWDGEQVTILDRQSASAQARLAGANVIVRSARGSLAQPSGALVIVLDY